VARPARVFDYFNQAHIAIVEGLVVPLYDTGRVPLGTIWIVSHDEDRRFDGNDVRVLEQLAIQLVLALKVQQAAIAHSERAKEFEERAKAYEQDVANKDAVIAEVHHRVKNSIQATVALLRLQCKTVRSSEAREVLTEAQTRLAVFSKVHELLYREAHSAQEVGMAALLAGLRDALRESFADRRERICLVVRAEAISLHPDQAIPLALIVNEAVTNAFKHAYPDEQSGEITVSFERIDGLMCLVISDNGSGITTAPRDGSLGLRLIRNFAQQVGGTLSISGESGTRISLILENR
jgi:two-component sensor histidine kinase